MIVPDAIADTCRGMAANLAGASGENMWTTPLSADGSAPATHWISVGMIDSSFAALLDDPALLAQAAGTTEAEAAALLGACGISGEDWPTASARTGLQIAQEDIEI